MPTLVEIINASVALTRRGNAHWAPCPFHAEKTSSFKVEEHRGKWRFYCFGCGARGDAADWIMLTRKVSYAEARRILGLGGQAKPGPAIIAAREAEKRRQRILRVYRNRNPDCCIPDWGIST